jgi:hypothetical protein
MVYCDIHIPQAAARCAVPAPKGKKLYHAVVMGDALGDLPEVGNHNMREEMEYRWVWWGGLLGAAGGHGLLYGRDGCCFVPFLCMQRRWGCWAWCG